MTHTPGPWRNVKQSVYSHDGAWIASTDSPYASYESATNNARLIAAAPDLLAALRGNDPEMLPSIQPLGWLYTAIQELKNPKAIQESYASDPDAWWMMINEIESLYERGRAAIAKATGAP